MAMTTLQGTNALILGSGIQILEEALSKAMVEGVTTPPFIEELDVKVGQNGLDTQCSVCRAIFSTRCCRFSGTW